MQKTCRAASVSISFMLDDISEALKDISEALEDISGTLEAISQVLEANTVASKAIRSINLNLLYRKLQAEK